MMMPRDVVVFGLTNQNANISICLHAWLRLRLPVICSTCNVGSSHIWTALRQAPEEFLGELQSARIVHPLKHEIHQSWSCKLSRWLQLSSRGYNSCFLIIRLLSEADNLLLAYFLSVQWVRFIYVVYLSISFSGRKTLSRWIMILNLQGGLCKA